ncbi:hypothetical protein Pcinc_019472 [Petrolisthes cinctipes]|uniref:Uncharacterized protein n=1 Tax=Petrolisthes cinctipes TaxID=88211 RepID=A0AAE1KLI3_PETCI|nr:hypothetical protein Pcinc_019472 [Petrolisthes cinctipes]
MDPVSPTHQTGSCRKMFTVNKHTHYNIWESEAWYQEESYKLESLLGRVEVGDNTISNPLIQVFSATRLSLMNGSIPYLPCKVREYVAKEVEECSRTRAARGASTWITFIGDSNQRLKVHSFLNFLPLGLNYKFYLGKQEVSQADFTLAVAHHDLRPPTFDIIGQRVSVDPIPSLHQTLGPDEGVDGNGPNTVFEPLQNQTPVSYGQAYTNLDELQTNSSVINGTSDTGTKEILLEKDVPLKDYEFRLTLVWAPAGSEMDHPTPRSGRKVNKLLDLASTMVVPDVIVIGFGTWMLIMREFDEELVPFSELDKLSRPLLSALTTLATRTNVLFWPQSRYRWFSYEQGIEEATDSEKWWNTFVYNNQFNNSLPFEDLWLWSILRKTGMWYWDSSVPFNLANIRECQRLSQAGLARISLYKGIGNIQHIIVTNIMWNFNVKDKRFDEDQKQMGRI